MSKIRVPEDMRKGYVHHTNNYGDVEVIEYKRCKDVDIIFLDTGSSGSYPAGDIRRGFVKDPSVKRVCRHETPEGFKVHDTIFIPKYCSEVRILEVVNANSVTIEFLETGYITKVTRHSLKNGSVKDPFQETTFGICDIAPDSNLKLYSVWRSMLNRVLGSSKPCYNSVDVCDDWLYFSKFKDWADTQDWEGKALDKDLKCREILIYSPKTCIFIDPLINSVITTFRRGETSGCYFNKERGKWQAQMTEPSTGKNIYLGRFDTKQEAEYTFKHNKIVAISKWISTVSDTKVRILLEDWLEFKTKPVVHETRLCNADGTPQE